MKWFLDVLRGMVIGLANVIPGVSGGTMMVSMGIYDKLIWSINHLFKKFKECVKILLPYGIGMVIAILLGAVGLKYAFEKFPLPTNALFIGLILGSLPFILKEMKGEKIGWQGVLIFAAFFALVVVLKVVEQNNFTEIKLTFFEVIKLFVLGAIASATMVIPGVSGSMMLKTLGYYEPIVTGALPDLMSAIAHGEWSAAAYNCGILIPFGLGIIFGIFAIAKLIEFLLKRWKGWTYCAILGMVLASPVVILMDTSIYEGFNAWVLVASIVTLAIGVLIALKLGGEPDAPAAEVAETETAENK